MSPFENLLSTLCFVFLQADWTTALTLWCQNMEVSAVIRPRVGVFPRRAPSICSVSPDTTSATSSVSLGAATGGGSPRYLPASPSKVGLEGWIHRILTSNVVFMFPLRFCALCWRDNRRLISVKEKLNVLLRRVTVLIGQFDWGLQRLSALSGSRVQSQVFPPLLVNRCSQRTLNFSWHHSVTQWLPDDNLFMTHHSVDPDALKAD